MITPFGTLQDVALLNWYSSGMPSLIYEFYQYGNILSPLGEYNWPTLTLWPSQSMLDINETGLSFLPTYPVPSGDEVFVPLPLTAGMINSVELFDHVGRIVPAQMSLTMGGLRVNVSMLSSGTYLLRLTGVHGGHIARIVKL